MSAATQVEHDARVSTVRWSVFMFVVSALLLVQLAVPFLVFERSQHAACERGNALRHALVVYIDRLADEQRHTHAQAAQITQFKDETAKAFHPTSCP